MDVCSDTHRSNVQIMLGSADILQCHAMEVVLAQFHEVYLTANNPTIRPSGEGNRTVRWQVSQSLFKRFKNSLTRACSVVERGSGISGHRP
jgi:hypothetical protein